MDNKSISLIINDTHVNPWDVFFSRKERKCYIFSDEEVNETTSSLEFIFSDTSNVLYSLTLQEIEDKQFVLVGQVYSDDNLQAITLMDDTYWEVLITSLISMFMLGHTTWAQAEYIYNSLWLLSLQQIKGLYDQVSKKKAEIFDSTEYAEKFMARLTTIYDIYNVSSLLEE